MAVDIAELMIKIGGDASELKNAVSDAKGSVESLSSTLGSVGKGLTVGVTAPIVAIGAAALKAASDVGSGYREIQRHTTDTGAALTALKGVYDNVFSSVPVGAKELGTSLASLNTMTGLTGAGLEELETKYINLSRVMDAPLIPTIESATMAFKAFGISAKDQSGELDNLYKVMLATNYAPAELLGTLQDGAPVLQAFGLNLDESAGFLGKLRDMGLDAAPVITAMRTEIAKGATEYKQDVAALESDTLALSKNTDSKKTATLSAQVYADKQKINTDLNQNLGESFTSLVTKIKNAKTETEGINLAMQAFGTKGGLAMYKAITDGSISLTNFKDVTKDVKTDINGMATSTTTLSDSMTVLKQRLELAMTPLGTAMTTAVKNAEPQFQALTGVVEQAGKAFAALPPDMQTDIVLIGGIGAAIGPTLVGVSQFASGIAQIGAAASGSTGGIKGYGLALGELTIVLTAALVAQELLNTQMDISAHNEVLKQANQAKDTVTGTKDDPWNFDLYGALDQFTGGGGNQKGPVVIKVTGDLTQFNSAMTTAVAQHREAQIVAQAITASATSDLDTTSRVNRIAVITAQAITSVAESNLTVTEKKTRIAEIIAQAQTNVAGSNLDATAKQRLATILAEAQTAAANGTLDAAALQRIAMILAQAETSGANAALNALVTPRTAYINVVTTGANQGTYIQNTSSTPYNVAAYGSGVPGTPGQGVPTMQQGGHVTSGPQMALIGEAGPEAVIPQKYWGGVAPWVLDSLPRYAGGVTTGGFTPSNYQYGAEANTPGAWYNEGSGSWKFETLEEQLTWLKYIAARDNAGNDLLQLWINQSKGVYAQHTAELAALNNRTSTTTTDTNTAAIASSCNSMAGSCAATASSCGSTASSCGSAASSCAATAGSCASTAGSASACAQAANTTAAATTQTATTVKGVNWTAESQAKYPALYSQGVGAGWATVATPAQKGLYERAAEAGIDPARQAVMEKMKGTTPSTVAAATTATSRVPVEGYSNVGSIMGKTSYEAGPVEGNWAAMQDPANPNCPLCKVYKKISDDARSYQTISKQIDTTNKTTSTTLTGIYQTALTQLGSTKGINATFNATDAASLQGNAFLTSLGVHLDDRGNLVNAQGVVIGNINDNISANQIAVAAQMAQIQAVQQQITAAASAGAQAVNAAAAAAGYGGAVAGATIGNDFGSAAWAAQTQAYQAQGIPEGQAWQLAINPAATFGSGWAGPTPLASGGYVDRPTFAHIGEDEPEYVIPGSKMKDVFRPKGNGGGSNQPKYQINMKVDGALDYKEIAKEVQKLIRKMELMHGDYLF